MSTPGPHGGVATRAVNARWGAETLLVAGIESQRELPGVRFAGRLAPAEYRTLLRRARLFIAAPKRLPVLWAKAAVYALVAFVLMLPPVLIAFFASQAILSRHHILQISFGHPGVARSVIGGAVYLMLIGIFALGLGAIVRNTAGGIATFAAIMFVIPPLMNLLPTSWNNAITQYLPSDAGRSLFSLSPGNHHLSPGAGAALFCGYIAVTLAIAAVLLMRRET